MKLIFEKNESGETIVKTNGKGFVSQDYIKMIKELHANAQIEVEFDENITEEERSSIEEMVDNINMINIDSDEVDESLENDSAIDYPDDDINPEDIPF